MAAGVKATSMLPLPGVKAPASAGRFFVASYNVLAQSLINRDQFGYASKKALRWKPRKQLLEKHITQLSETADVMCLQEVDNYDEFYGPLLERLGFSAHYKQKPQGSHGCVVAYRSTRFESVFYEEVDFNDLGAGHAPGSVFFDEIVRNNVGQTVGLRLKEESNEVGGAGVIVTNCHLFWNHKYRYVRLRQTMHLLERAMVAQARLRWPVVCCGDFNDCPDTIVRRLMTSERPFPFWVAPEVFLVPPEHFFTGNDKENNSSFFKSEDPMCYSTGKLIVPLSELKEGQDPRESDAGKTIYELMKKRHLLSLPDGATGQRVPEEVNVLRVAEIEALMKQFESLPQLKTVYGQYQEMTDRKEYDVWEGTGVDFWEGDPIYTNYTPTWSGTLDYIFHACLPEESQSCILTPLSILKIPNKEEVTAQAGLPSDHFPSDHVPIMCEFAYILRGK